MSKEEVTEVSKHFGEKVETSVKVDPTLIGGITVRTENTILDGSIKTQLERLRQQL
jgi:F-type H+-transporting ATPase subunit delta